VADKKAQFTLDTICQACQGYFSPLSEVETVYLFGSYAEGDPGPMSDVDLAVLYKRDLTPEQLRAAFLRDWALVSKALKTDNVDFVCLNLASSIELKFAIVQDGIVVLDRSANRLGYECAVRTEYFDHISTLRLAGYVEEN
jgi:predicted nucleotidyltransferase